MDTVEDYVKQWKANQEYLEMVKKYCRDDNENRIKLFNELPAVVNAQLYRRRQNEFNRTHAKEIGKSLYERRRMYEGMQVAENAMHAFRLKTLF